MPTDRAHLRNSFDNVALQYDRSRPDYPSALIDDVIALSGIADDDRILEVGSGTGIATELLARRGYRVETVEIGAAVAAVAKEKLRGFSNVTINVGDFEEWPIADGAYGLAVSAQAFHWIDPEIGFPKLARALKPGGAIALWWNRQVRTGDGGFFTAVQPIYDRAAPAFRRGELNLPRLEELPTPVKEQIERSGWFGAVTIRTFPWNLDYTAAAYVDLLGTYSDHIAMDPVARDKLFRGIADLIDRDFGGRITKEHVAVLYVAHRKE
jgi:SAM-dependent methyltransferase